jgi:hypothetical protein
MCSPDALICATRGFIRATRDPDVLARGPCGLGFTLRLASLVY